MTGFVFLNKEEGMTSFIAAGKLRKIFGEKKVGHTGTLDPMATGVMVVALGSATKFIELIPSHNKSYEAQFLLGKTTDTLDITGKVLSEKPSFVTREELVSCLQKFKGEISQLPPMYSAVKKDGKKLYELARKGIEIEREKRVVTVYSLELLSFDEENQRGVISVHCSSGTYIRSLISDVGESLKVGAVLSGLKRTKANGVELSRCETAAELSKMESEELLKHLVSVEDFLPFPKIFVTAAQSKRFSNGGELSTERLKGSFTNGLYKIYSPEERFLGVGEIDLEKNELRMRKLFREDNNAQTG